jgi:GGDEF domain-containing protein
MKTTSTDPKAAAISGPPCSSATRGSAVLDACSRSDELIAEGVRLLVFERQALVDSIPIQATPITIGRSSDCNIRVDDAAVSRVHCSVCLLGGSVILTDLDSKNGVYRYGRKVLRARLSVGDELTIGSVLLKLSLTHAEPWSNSRNVFALLYTDPQTGLLNRRGLEMRFAAAAAALVAGSLIGVLLVRLSVRAETQAEVNRRGEDLLISIIAERLASAMTRLSVVARVGPRDFQIVQLGGSIDALREVVSTVSSRIGSALAGRPCPAVQIEYTVGGAAGRFSNDTLRELESLADDALHHALWQRLPSHIFDRSADVSFF